MSTQAIHRSGLYPAVQAPRMRGQWLARMPLVVGAVAGLTMWVAVVAGVLYAA